MNMDEEHKKIKTKEVIDGLECGQFKHAHDIVTLLTNLPAEYLKEIETLRFEYLAFAHCPSQENPLGWETYYGPYYVFANDDGKTAKVPFNQEDVTDDVIKYWKKRAFESNNPFLYMRYADLVVDYHVAKIHEVEDVHKYLERHVDGIINLSNMIVRGEYDDHRESVAMGVFDGMKRVSQLIIQFNFFQKVQNLAELCFALEKKVGDDETPGLWDILLTCLCSAKGFLGG